MEFSLIDERSVDSSPKVMVTFPDGYKDSLVLRKNHFDVGDKMEVDEGCNYIGHLEIEKDACVAMTGCFGSDDIEFTIMSRHATGSTGFVWTKEGEIHTVDGDKKVYKYNPEIINGHIIIKRPTIKSTGDPCVAKHTL